MKQGLPPRARSLPVETKARGLGILLWTEPSYLVCFPEWGAQKRTGASLGGQEPSRSSGAKAACGMARVLGGQCCELHTRGAGPCWSRQAVPACL